MAIKMTELQAVNLCLRALGEQEVPSVLESYPTIELAQRALEDASIDTQIQGWWFNKTLCARLQCTTDGLCPTPNNTLVFIPKHPQYKWVGDSVVMESGDPELDAAAKSHGVVGELTSYIEFEDLPSIAQRAVAYTAAGGLYVNDVGVDNVYQIQAQKAMAMLLKMGAVHTRSRHFNSHHKKQIARFFALRHI